MKYLSPISIGKLETKNRLVVPPMASQTADERGHVTSSTLSHYERLASSCAGLVFVEYTYVHLFGRSEPNQLGIDSDEKILGFKKLSKIIKESGAIAGLQITYAGGKGSRELSDGSLLSPSGIKVPTYKGELESPDIATKKDIKMIVQSFIDGADRAYQAGFDVVEIHCAHGYGINQWLSPITNQRVDSYGGSLFNRARILFEIIDGIKALVPKIEIAVRVPGQDMLEGGLSYNDMKYIVNQLQENGVSLIDVSNGLGGWRRPKDRRGQGYLFEDAIALREATYLPIIGVGGVTEPEFIEESLNKKLVDLVAVGRSILEDPLFWKRSIC